MTGVRRPAPDPVGPGQESVWDYPRPPRIEPTAEHVEIRLGGVVIADTRTAYRVLETAGPPTYYLARDAFRDVTVTRAPGRSVCEWKGLATYWTLAAGGTVAETAAWSYEDPTPAFRVLRGFLAVYPARVDECRVDGEAVRPQPGGFYGGWITRRIVGPFKGGPGSQGW
jgi:uncharacterized protein (DUF427 family)